MKLKKASLKIVICLLFVVLLGTTLVACNNDSAKKFDYYVTFDYNTGNLTENELTQQYIGVKKNSLISARPGYSDDLPERSVSGYYIEGWYTAKTDENGEPLKDENGFVLLDEKWNFELKGDKQRVNANITLYANLKKQSVIRFIDIKTGKYADNEILGNPAAKRSEPSGNSLPRLDGYTLLRKNDNKNPYDFYYDADRTRKVEWPYTFTENDIEMYVDFIEGRSLNFVYTETQFISAMNSGGNIYLMNDLDFTESANFWAAGVSYGGELNGNGYKVTGLQRTAEKNNALQATRLDNTNKGGIFGTILSTAHIHDVTFDECKVEYTFGGTPSVGWAVALFAWKAESGAKIENVTVSGSLTYDSGDGLIRGVGWIANDETESDDVKNVSYTGITVTIL